MIMVCEQVRQKLLKALMPNEGLVDKAKETVGVGQTPATQAAKSDQPIDYERAFDALGVSVVEEYGEWKPAGAPMDSFRAMHKGQMRMVGGPEMGDKIAYAFGAGFVEVRINKWTHEIRVPRLLGAFAAGHIMNPRTARSQLMGGLIWGMSSALHEATELDKRYARYVNDNLADYLVPVNADVASVEVIMLSEEDNQINPAGVKGIGELGNVGMNAAVCNAIFHATGQRQRKLPVRLEHWNYSPGLPPGNLLRRRRLSATRHSRRAHRQRRYRYRARSGRLYPSTETVFGETGRGRNVGCGGHAIHWR